MNQIKRRRLYHLLSAILLSCFSGTFLLMPVAGRVDQGNVRAALGLVGALFWLTGIGGYTLFFLARRRDGKGERAEKTAEKKKRKKKKEKQGFTVDGVTVALDIVIVVGIVILLVWSGKLFMQRYGAYVVLFITTMAFHTRLLRGSRPDRGGKSPQEGKQTAQGEKADQGGKKAAQGEKTDQGGKKTAQEEKVDQGGKKAAQGEKAAQSGKQAEQGEKEDQSGNKTDQGEKAAQSGKQTVQGEKVAQGEKANQSGKKAVQGEKANQSGEKAAQGGKKADQGGKKADQGGKKGTGKKDVGRR